MSKKLSEKDPEVLKTEEPLLPRLGALLEERAEEKAKEKEADKKIAEVSEPAMPEGEDMAAEGAGKKESKAAPAVLQTVPQSVARLDIPTQKPPDDERRSDGGRSIPKIPTKSEDRDDGKAVLDGELAAAVAKAAEKNKGTSKKDEEPAKDENGEALIEADLLDDVGLNGKTYLRGRQAVPKALVDSFPMVVKPVKSPEVLAKEAEARAKTEEAAAKKAEDKKE